MKKTSENVLAHAFEKNEMLYNFAITDYENSGEKCSFTEYCNKNWVEIESKFEDYKDNLSDYNSFKEKYINDLLEGDPDYFDSYDDND